MSVRHDVQQLLARDEIVAAPEQRACTDRSFGLPTAMYGAYFGLLFAYLGVMAFGFPHPEMILPMAIFVIFLTGAIVTPALWVRMKPDHGDRALSMDRFLGEGIATLAGHSSANAAMIQMLMLPVLILMWGVAVVTIAALS